MQDGSFVDGLLTNVVTEKKPDLVAVAMDENVWVLVIISGRSGELLWYQEIDSNLHFRNAISENEDQRQLCNNEHNKHGNL